MDSARTIQNVETPHFSPQEGKPRVRIKQSPKFTLTLEEVEIWSMTLILDLESNEPHKLSPGRWFNVHAGHPGADSGGMGCKLRASSHFLVNTYSELHKPNPVHASFLDESRTSGHLL
jgi:hypothetical protein